VGKTETKNRIILTLREEQDNIDFDRRAPEGVLRRHKEGMLLHTDRPNLARGCTSILPQMTPETPLVGEHTTTERT
jgi:hypothetical protein